MSDLWPEFNIIEQEDNNDAINIIREQARALGKKLDNKVKATFSKVSYSKSATGITASLEAIAKISTAVHPNAEEILEEELQGKIDITKLLEAEKYKFEIFNNSYRFRLFLYNYMPLYPNTIIIDEGISKELGQGMTIIIHSNQELSELLHSIFSTQRVRKIIGMMITRTESDRSNIKT